MRVLPAAEVQRISSSPPPVWSPYSPVPLSSCLPAQTTPFFPHTLHVWRQCLCNPHRILKWFPCSYKLLNQMFQFRSVSLHLSYLLSKLCWIKRQKPEHVYLLLSRSACSCILASSKSLLFSSYFLRKDENSLHLSSYLFCSAEISSWSLATCSFCAHSSAWAFQVYGGKRTVQNNVHRESAHFSNKVLQINYKDVRIKGMRMCNGVSPAAYRFSAEPILWILLHLYIYYEAVWVCRNVSSWPHKVRTKNELQS